MTLALARLKRAAPSSFEDFETELNSFTAQRSEECVQAPGDRVLITQGKAQQLVELRNLVANCVNEATQLEAKLKQQPK